MFEFSYMKKQYKNLIKITIAASIILILAASFITLTSCAQVTKTEVETVEAVVVNSYHHSAWIQQVWTGKFFTSIHHPERNEITVEYNGLTETFNDEDLYNQFKDSIGSKIAVMLTTTYYDNGNITQNLSLIEQRGFML